MIAEMIAGDLPEFSDAPFGFWCNDETSKDTINVSCVLAPRHVADSIASTVWSAGLEPLAIDVQYCALARAAESGDTSTSSKLMLNIGSASSTLVLCKEARPLQVRLLRNTGLQSFLNPVAHTLSLSLTDSFELLKNIGIFTTSTEQGLLPARIADFS